MTNLRRTVWSSLLALGVGLLAAGVTRAESLDARLDLDALERKIEMMRSKVQSIDSAYARAESELRGLENRVVLRGRAYYRLSRSDHGDNFLDHAVKLERLRQGLVSDQSRLSELRTLRDRSAEQRAKLESALRPLVLEREAAGRARDALVAQTERERAFQLAFQSHSARPDHTAIYSANSTLEYVGESFSALRGRLPFPLSGRSEVETVKKANVPGPGLLFRATMPSPVRSVFAGKVVFSDEHPDYEKAVIIDHGEGYFTVTAGLGSIEVKKGDDVAAGSRLGSMKAMATPSVYIEVRRNQEILAPLEWFGL